MTRMVDTLRLMLGALIDIIALGTALALISGAAIIIGGAAYAVGALVVERVKEHRKG